MMQNLVFECYRLRMNLCSSKKSNTGAVPASSKNPESATIDKKYETCSGFLKLALRVSVNLEKAVRMHISAR